MAFTLCLYTVASSLLYSWCIVSFQCRGCDEDHDHWEAVERHACSANSDRHTPGVWRESDRGRIYELISVFRGFPGFSDSRALSPFSQIHPKELNNGIINAAFLLLFKDLVKLFASYNDGVINLLGQSSTRHRLKRPPRRIWTCKTLSFAEKYFKMKKSDCKEALEIYKRFLTRVAKIGEFMKLAEVRGKPRAL